jgi:hypothetical protein
VVSAKRRDRHCWVQAMLPTGLSQTLLIRDSKASCGCFRALHKHVKGF